MASSSGQGSGSTNAEKGIRLLALDGGPDAMPTVLILKALMRYVLEEENDRRRRRGDPEEAVLPRPCQYFELVGGSGHGGLISLMLGVLRMEIDEVEQEYASMLEEMKHTTSPTERSQVLRNELRRLIARVAGHPDSIFLNSQMDDKMCKTFVTAMNTQNMSGNTPTLFRSYGSADSTHTDCKIWEAGRATIAMRNLFDPIEIGRSVPYIEGLGSSNPTKLVLEEAADVFKERKIACVVTIGTGHSETISLSRSSLTQMALNMVKDCEKMHQDMVRRFANHKTLYYRFNVQQGLQMKEGERVKNAPEVESQTYHYLLSGEVKQKMKQAAMMVVQATGRVYPDQLRTFLRRLCRYHLLTDIGVSPAPARKVDGLLIRPSPPSRIFIGREVILEAMEECFIPSGQPRSASSKEQKRFVLCGLGGSGKTQLALKFIQLHSSKFSNIYVINASSEETVNTALENIGLELGIPDSTPSDTRDYFCRSEEQWLLLFDNADDPSLNLHNFFPPCDHGNIIITSRNQQSSNFSQPSTATQRVQGMIMEDSVTLLASLTSHKKLDAKDLDLLPTVAETLGHLALALVQCGSYVATVHGMTFPKYLAIFTKRRKDLLARHTKPPVDMYEDTVSTTWEINFEALSSLSKILLSVCSFFHFDGITPDIFGQAAVNISQDVYLHKECYNPGFAFLSHFSPLTDDAEADWDDYQLNEAIVELSSYSLMQDGAEGLLSIHPLVQFWCKDRATKEDYSADLCTAQAIAALSADEGEDEKSCLHRRLLLPHLHAVLAASSSQRANHDVNKRFARAFNLAGQHGQAERLWVDIVHDEAIQLGREDPDTLRSMNHLANTYQDQGRHKEAEVLQLEVLELQKRVLGSTNLETLGSMNNLGCIYQKQGRHKDAEKLQLEVLNIRRRILGPAHPHTLSSMNNLANTYLNQGCYAEAKRLQLEVLEDRKRVFGSTHPSTLSIMHNLATANQGQGCHKGARDLLLEVIEGRKRVLGPAHPDTISSMSNLANMYRNQGQPTESQNLYLEVLEMWKHIPGPVHPDMLTSMNNLANAYADQDRYKEANELLLEVLEVRKQVLGPAHPDTLSSMDTLALTYANQGRLEEARVLMIDVVNGRQEHIGPEHPDTVKSIGNLELIKRELE